MKVSSALGLLLTIPALAQPPKPPPFSDALRAQVRELESTWRDRREWARHDGALTGDELAEAQREFARVEARLDAIEPPLVKELRSAMDQAFNLASCRSSIRSVDPARVKRSSGMLLGGAGAFGRWNMHVESADPACSLVTKRLVEAVVSSDVKPRLSETMERQGRCDAYFKGYYDLIDLHPSIANLTACIEFPLLPSRASAQGAPLPNAYFLDGFLVLRHGSAEDGPGAPSPLSELYAIGADGAAVYLTNSMDEDVLPERVRRGDFDYLK